MRRTDREITNPAAIDEIIRACPCCRLGVQDGEGVYLVPLSFGFTHADGRRTLYFHSASDGHKLELLRTGRPAAFELDRLLEITGGPIACKYSARYQSVLGQGHVRFLTTPEEKAAALREIMFQNTGRRDWEFADAALSRVVLFALDVETISAKQHV